MGAWEDVPQVVPLEEPTVTWKGTPGVQVEL